MLKGFGRAEGGKTVWDVTATPGSVRASGMYISKVAGAAAP